MDLLKQKIINNGKYENLQEHNILVVDQKIEENKHGDQYLVVYWCYVGSIDDDLTVERLALPLWGEKIPKIYLDNKDYGTL